MARSVRDEVVRSVREGLAREEEQAERGADAVARRLEEALEEAGAIGRRIRRDLQRRWTAVDRAGRENAFVMALGALGLGVLIGWLMTRDRG